MALYGLQRLGDSEEARQLVAALTPKVQHCREELDAQAVGNALYGLQQMGDSHVEVRQLVAALTPKVTQCREALGAQEVGNALSGSFSCNFVLSRADQNTLSHIHASLSTWAATRRWQRSRF